MAKGFRTNFFTTYANKFLPNVKEKEKERQKRFARLLLIETILLFIILYLLLSYIGPITGTSKPEENSFMALILSTLGPIIIMGGAYLLVTLPESENKKFKNEIKTQFMYDLIKVFGNIKPVSDSYYLATMVGLTSSGLFPEYDEREYDDAFIGWYNDVEYAVIEAELRRIIEVHTRYGTREQRVRLFKGVILSYPCYKTINAHTIITPKHDIKIPSFNISAKVKSVLYALALVLFLAVLVAGLTLGFAMHNNIATVIYILTTLSLLCAACYKIRSNTLKRLRVEDVDFEKDYIVKSEDQVEGRYLVTTAFIDRFKKLQKIYNTKNIKCAFWGNTITFAIETNEDMFELGSLYSPLTDSRVIEKFFDEVTSIFDLIDLFKLNEDTKL